MSFRVLSSSILSLGVLARVLTGFQVVLVVKNPLTQCRSSKRHGFDPWGWGRDPGGVHSAATHSSILGWSNPMWIGEPGGLQYIGSHKVRHDSRD